MSMGSQPGVFSELSRCVSWGSQPPVIPGLPPGLSLPNAAEPDKKDALPAPS